MMEVKTQLNAEIAKKQRFLAAAILLLPVKLLYLDSLPESFESSLSKCNTKWA